MNPAQRRVVAVIQHHGSTMPHGGSAGVRTVVAGEKCFSWPHSFRAKVSVRVSSAVCGGDAGKDSGHVVHMLAGLEDARREVGRSGGRADVAGGERADSVAVGGAVQDFSGRNCGGYSCRRAVGTLNVVAGRRPPNEASDDRLRNPDSMDDVPVTVTGESPRVWSPRHRPRRRRRQPHLPPYPSLKIQLAKIPPVALVTVVVAFDMTPLG